MMTRAYIVFGLCFLAILSIAHAHALANEWKAFMQEHNKLYANEKEENYRQHVWEKNVRLIQQHNTEADRGEHTYWLNVNKYADMTDDEFDRTMTGLNTNVNRPLKPEVASLEDEGLKLPKTFDWREKGFRTPVKDQGHCASCYAFAALGALEAQHFMKTGCVVSLSEQNIIDCTDDNVYMNNGCHKGRIDMTYNYIMDKGVDSAESYPYIAKVERCRFNKTSIGSKLTDYGDVWPPTDRKLQISVVKHGPVAAGMDARGEWFRFYSHGVYDRKECSQTNLTHAVVVVGYGRVKKQNYWILKNSYGTSWGMDGYMYLVKGNNTCGIATSAFYPIL